MTQPKASTTFPADREAQIARVRALVGDGVDSTKWSLAWQQGATPWDSGGHAQPSLVGFMTKTDEGKQLHAGSRSQCRVLVPGCGSGYDVVYFAHQAGYGEVVGIDIAPEAVKTAQAWYEKTHAGAEHPGSARFLTFDYLTPSKESAELGEFDLVYDYTFFCALPPALRQQWADAHKRAVKSGGFLLCLVFPNHGDRQGGPPYSVSPELYTSLLQGSFTLEYEGIPPSQPESRKGVESIMLWRRK